MRADNQPAAKFTRPLDGTIMAGSLRQTKPEPGGAASEFTPPGVPYLILTPAIECRDRRLEVETMKNEGSRLAGTAPAARSGPFAAEAGGSEIGCATACRPWRPRFGAAESDAKGKRRWHPNLAKAKLSRDFHRAFSHLMGNGPAADHL
jgi:hypothetical protein